MLSALGIFVGLSDKKNLKKFGILEKVPLPTIITIILSISDGFCQAYYIEKETATETFTNIFSNISCVSKVFQILSNAVILHLLLFKTSNFPCMKKTCQLFPIFNNRLYLIFYYEKV